MMARVTHAKYLCAAALFAALPAAAGTSCGPRPDIFADSFEGEDACPLPGDPVCATYTIDYCRLQFPSQVNAPEGSQIEVFGRLYIAGLTDQSGANDPMPAQVTASVGYGPDGSDPAIDTCWVWTEAGPNPGYSIASPGYEPDLDEYQAVLTVPSPPGAYDFAYRFSGDDGQSFSHCDLGDGSANGYSPSDAGVLTSEPASP
jgi:hypothetical protein